MPKYKFTYEIEFGTFAPEVWEQTFENALKAAAEEDLPMMDGERVTLVSTEQIGD